MRFYKYSFFPQTIRDWNDLPESLISSSELSTGPDSANGRAFASGAGGRGFDPWPRHTFGMPLNCQPVPIAQMVERLLQEREVVGSIPGRAIPKALKMVPVATLLGAQNYKASTGSPLTHY